MPLIFNKKYIKTMRKPITILLLLFISAGVYSQKVIKEATFDPDGKAKITNLTEVQIDEDNNQMILFYLTKSTARKVKAEILYFDLDFNYIKTENLEDDIEKVRQKYKLHFSFDFCPETKEPLLTVEPNWLTGQTVFKKGYIENYFNWLTGYCDNRFNVDERVRPKGEDGEKLKLLNFWTNNDLQQYIRTTTSNVYSYGYTATYRTAHAARPVMNAEKGDVVICAAVYDRKNLAEAGKRWVFEMFSVKSMEKLKSTPLDFPVAAAPVKYKFLSTGNVGYLFQRADNKFEYIEVEFNGSIVRRNEIAVPNMFTWVVYEMSEVGDDIFIHGVTSKTKVNPKYLGNAAYLPQSSLQTRNTYGEKPNGYQIMKISPSKIDWVTFTDIKEFKPTFVQVGSEKGKPFTGGILKICGLDIGPTGNIFITGQKYTSGPVVMGISTSSYQEVVAFNFNSSGKLISNYSTKLRKKNEYNKATPTEHALLNAPDGSGVYWTIFEVAGAKKWGETARMLYYPRVAKISNDGKAPNDFLDIGNGDYYLDDKFPVNPIKDNKVIFIGADRKGKLMWFSKVQFD